MHTLVQKLKGSIRRVFPACITQAQTVAFNMFLAFFPMLLFAFGILSTTEALKQAAAELPDRLGAVLPPGSDRMVVHYLTRRGSHPWQWMWLGLGGTLLAGTQVIIGLMEGFRIVSGDRKAPGFLTRQLRALLLLCLTLGPWLAAAVLSVFGKDARGWLIREYGLPNLLQQVSVVVYVGSVLLLGFGVLVVVYHLGGRLHRGWRSVVPGALLATVLWWIVDVSFGFYVKHMPYDLVYGSLAAAIGLLLWMYMSAIIVFLGAAYNAESHQIGS